VAHRVRLIGAAGCHLCDAARSVVRAVHADEPFELEEITVDGDDTLEARYRERIPVVEIDGEEAFTYFVHPEGLRRRLGRL